MFGRNKVNIEAVKGNIEAMLTPLERITGQLQEYNNSTFDRLKALILEATVDMPDFVSPYDFDQDQIPGSALLLREVHDTLQDMTDFYHPAATEASEIRECFKLTFPDYESGNPIRGGGLNVANNAAWQLHPQMSGTVSYLSTAQSNLNSRLPSKHMCEEALEYILRAEGTNQDAALLSYEFADNLSSYRDRL